MNGHLQGEKPLILLIGNVDREGVLSTISQSGRWYKRKVLHSQPSNWQSIIDTLTLPNVSAALVLLTPLTYRYINNYEYTEVRELVFKHVAEVPHAVFIHDNLYHGTRDGELADEFDYPDEGVRKRIEELLAKYNVNVVTYQKSSEVTLLAVDFLGHVETGLMLRLYVPNNQLWANETDRLLQLFRDYLTRIANIDVRLDETRTKAGVIYELRGAPNGNVELSDEFKEFSKFMTLCTTDPAKAELILLGKDVSQANIIQILTRYSKEARRLQVDMRQDREQKILRIRHRLESELIDVMPSDADLSAIGMLVEQTIPSIAGPHSLLQLTSPSKSITANNLTLNLNPQFVETVNGIVAQEISGDIGLNENDRKLLDLFAEFGERQHADLVSALRELRSCLKNQPVSTESGKLLFPPSA
ncbi:hypothetical protein [Rubinisphaera brasiliensis]|nr:hypothetical protein [Rubinisphaera brasiliensis]